MTWLSQPARNVAGTLSVFLAACGAGDLAVKAMHFLVGYESQSFEMPLWLSISALAVGGIAIYFLGLRRAPY